jgi:hypothetical protein
MSKDDALNIDLKIPEGVTLKSLEKSNAKQINDVWPHKHEGSEKYFIGPLIEYNPSIGAFIGDELVAWCLRYNRGYLNFI